MNQWRMQGVDVRGLVLGANVEECAMKSFSGFRVRKFRVTEGSAGAICMCC